MSSLITRSASLTNLSQAGIKDNRGDDEETDKCEKVPLKFGTPHRQKKKMVNHSTSTPNASSSSKWTWLSQPTRSFHEKQPNGSHRSSNIPASRQDLQEPTMTRHVEHLETLLPQYCRYLSHPTYQEAANAMSLLLNNPPLVPLAATTSTTLPTSPEKTDSNINRLLSSPFRARRPQRIKTDQDPSVRWSAAASMASSPAISNSTASSFHDKLQAASWHSFVAPLVLLAGAEAVYADLEHVHPTPTIIAWTGLYQRLAKQLHAMIPFTKTKTAPNNNAEPKNSVTRLSRTEGPLAGDSMEALPAQASSVGTAKTNTSSSSSSPSIPISTSGGTEQDKSAAPHYLKSLLTWLDWKRQWLPFHESLFLTWSRDMLTGIRAFAKSLPLQPDNDMLMQALGHEVHATLEIMEMAFWLERGR
jgi:hypothetical protein